MCLCCYLAAYSWYTLCRLSKDVHHSGDLLVLRYGTYKIPTNVFVLFTLLAAWELRAENFYIFFVIVGSEGIENCWGVVTDDRLIWAPRNNAMLRFIDTDPKVLRERIW
jgi:hypothetical protein